MIRFHNCILLQVKGNWCKIFDFLDNVDLGFFIYTEIPSVPTRDTLIYFYIFTINIDA